MALGTAKALGPGPNAKNSTAGRHGLLRIFFCYQSFCGFPYDMRKFRSRFHLQIQRSFSKVGTSLILELSKNQTGKIFVHTKHRANVTIDSNIDLSSSDPNIQCRPSLIDSSITSLKKPSIHYQVRKINYPSTKTILTKELLHQKLLVSLGEFVGQFYGLKKNEFCFQSTNTLIKTYHLLLKIVSLYNMYNNKASFELTQLTTLNLRDFVEQVFPLNLQINKLFANPNSGKSETFTGPSQIQTGTTYTEIWKTSTLPLKTINLFISKRPEPNTIKLTGAAEAALAELQLFYYNNLRLKEGTKSNEIIHHVIFRSLENMVKLLMFETGYFDLATLYSILE